MLARRGILEKDIARAKTGQMSISDLAGGLITGIKPIQSTKKLEVFDRTDFYIRQYEKVLQEKEEEAKW